MPRSREREEARVRMVEAAMIYLDAGGIMSASLIEPMPDNGRLELDLRRIPGEPQTQTPGRNIHR